MRLPVSGLHSYWPPTPIQSPSYARANLFFRLLRPENRKKWEPKNVRPFSGHVVVVHGRVISAPSNMGQNSMIKTWDRERREENEEKKLLDIEIKTQFPVKISFIQVLLISFDSWFITKRHKVLPGSIRSFSLQRHFSFLFSEFWHVLCHFGAGRETRGMST